MDIGRREFLGCGLGLVATSALPASVAVGWERLVLAYQHVHIGLPEPFSVLHISDTHLTAAYPHEPEIKRTLSRERTLAFGSQQELSLSMSLAWAKRNVDCVVHTGDLIDWQSEANLDLARKYLGDISLAAVGNHEYSPSMSRDGVRDTGDDAQRAKTSAALARAFPFPLDFRAQTVRGVNFVMVDDVFGTVTAEQVRRFEAEVRKGLPIILCMHVPFYTDEIWRASCKFWSGRNRKYRAAALPDPYGDCKRQREDAVTRDFIAALRQEKLLRGILAGHLHIAVQERFSPTAVQYVVGGNFLFHGQEILLT